LSLYTRVAVQLGTDQMSSPLLSLTSLPLILLTSSSLLSPLEVNLLKLKDFAFVFISYFCEIQRDDLCCVELTERLKEKIEETFGCEYELFIEFTGLIRLVSLPCLFNKTSQEKRVNIDSLF